MNNINGTSSTDNTNNINITDSESNLPDSTGYAESEDMNTDNSNYTSSKEYDNVYPQHEPSGMAYMNGNGNKIENLGVHEHWNNSVDKQYSRNLGKDEGIELIYIKK